MRVLMSAQQSLPRQHTQGWYNNCALLSRGRTNNKKSPANDLHWRGLLFVETNQASDFLAAAISQS